MNIKKKLYEEIVAKLKSEQNELNHKIWKNKYDLKNLVEKQIELKRKRKPLNDLIWELIKKEVK